MVQRDLKVTSSYTVDEAVNIAAAAAPKAPSLWVLEDNKSQHIVWKRPFVFTRYVFHGKTPKERGRGSTPYASRLGREKFRPTSRRRVG